MNICQLSRFFFGSALDGGTQPPRFAAKHIEQCQSCAEWVAHQQIVFQAVKRRPAQADPSPFFEARVMSNVRRESQPEKQFSLRFATLAVTFIIVLGIGSLLLLNSRRNPTPPTQTLTTLDFQQALAKVPAPDLAELPKIDQPLEKEFTLVISDTKNAIRSIASSFLPDDMLEQR
jgi:hypothetical protein